MLELSLTSGPFTVSLKVFKENRTADVEKSLCFSGQKEKAKNMRKVFKLKGYKEYQRSYNFLI